MASFQAEFFPDIYARTASGAGDDDPWCKFHDHRLQLFSSVMFLSGAVVALPAGYAARAYGRKVGGRGRGVSGGGRWQTGGRRCSTPQQQAPLPPASPGRFTSTAYSIAAAPCPPSPPCLPACS